MYLKVKNERVVCVEPRIDFPFNQGKLCPKGISRYLQNNHPDRLLRAYCRDADAPGGFRAIEYDEAITRVASEIERIQRTHGADAMAVLSGASLTTEKTYLMGKFARVCLKTRHIDYNGRLCMVSAAAGNKKAFGVDRAANPMADVIGAEVVWISGANVAECAPITTDYVWQAREHGARIIVVDPRITPIARTCDLFLPIRPGRDVALFNGVLHLMIEHDWLDHEFIRDHTQGFEAVAEHVRAWTPARTAHVTGIAERAVRQAAEWWGTARTSFLMHARGIEHSSHGVQNVLGAINLVLASGRIGRPGCGYATITGQGNGQGGREHGQKCDQLPGGRDIVSQFLSGTQTRRIGPLLDHYPAPRVEMHPTLAERLGIADGDRVTVETRRGALTAPALVVGTVRPDTIFVPYHWPGAQSINRLTIAAQDPISKIPEYKACAARLRSAADARVEA
jgi:assimilatory nitrate reductase catalytic subunit